MGKKRIALSAAIIALSAAAAQASDDAPRPIGTVTVELDLSNGDTKQLIANEFSDSANFIDPDNPTASCSPPFTREIAASAMLGPAVLAEIKLTFDEYELNRPAVMLSGTSATSLIAVDLRSNSKPADIAKWKPKTAPAREGADWRIDTTWDFDPAALTFDLSDPNKAPEYVAPRWIDPESGNETAETIVRARVSADLRLKATYEQDAQPKPLPCP